MLCYLSSLPNLLGEVGLELRPAKPTRGQDTQITIPYFKQVRQQKAIGQALLRTNLAFTKRSVVHIAQANKTLFPTHLGTYQSPGLPSRPGRAGRLATSPPADTRRSGDRCCPGGVWK